MKTVREATTEEVRRVLTIGAHWPWQRSAIKSDQEMHKLLVAVFILNIGRSEYGVVENETECIYSSSWETWHLAKLLGLDSVFDTPWVPRRGTGKHHYKFPIGIGATVATIRLVTMEEVRPMNVFENEKIERLINYYPREHFGNLVAQFDWAGFLPEGTGRITQPFAPDEALCMLQFPSESPLELKEVLGFSIDVEAK